MTEIIVDNRESTKIIKELEKEKINVIKKQLITADYIIQTKNNEDQIQTVGIERKTQQDFINSIIDGRLLNQLFILKENFDIPLLILEGDHNIYRIRNMHPNSIRGMLTTIAVDMQVPIINTMNQNDTAKFLINISNRLEKRRKPLTLITRKKPITIKDKQQYLLESLPGVGPTLAKNLLEKFKTIKKISNAKREQLLKVKKIGKKKADEIAEVFEFYSK